MNKELEEVLCRIEMHKDYAGLTNGTCIVNKQDLETVLEELKRLQEENKEYKKIKDIADGVKLEEVEEAIKRANKEFIEKDKIREKIENEKINISGLEVITAEDLKELLEGK